MKYIIVTALKDEAHELDEFAPVVHTGIGKVNACINLYAAILKYQPDMVLNYGTAGAIADLSGLYEIDHFVQIDMDVRGLDFPRGITPLMNEKLPVKTGLVLGTGDSFITNAGQQLEGLDIAIDLVDMEAYALKKVCEHHQVTFAAYKFISDSANEAAGNDWKNSIKNGTHLFADIIKKKYGYSDLG
jgi:adenosylhomocysteine nucleosidase